MEAQSRQSLFAPLFERTARIVSAPQVLALADQAVVSGASFVTTVMIGRYTVPSQLGTYALAGAMLIWLTNAQESLISLPYTIRRKADPVVAAVQGGHALMLSGLLSALCVIAFALLAIWTFTSHSGVDDAVAIMWALASIVPFVIYRDFARRFAFAELRNGEALALDSTIVVLQVGTLGWLAWSDHLTSATALGALGFACAAAVLMWFALVRKRLRFTVRHFWKSTHDSWMLGKWLFANQLLGAVQSQMTLWFVALAVGAMATGIYTACMSIALFANPIILGISNMLWAKAARAFEEGGSARLIRESIADAAQLGAIISVFFFAILVWGDDILHLLYPAPEYAGYGHVVTVLAFSQLVFGVSMPASTALAGMGEVRTNFAVGAVETVILAALIWPLVHHWGIIGAAYGILAGTFLRLIIRWGAVVAIVRGAGRAATEKHSAEALDALLSVIARNGKRWKITPLHLKGSQGELFFASHDAEGGTSRADAALIVKLYRPERKLEAAEIRGQYGALRRLHKALDGCRYRGWTICIPAPILVSDTPLALVMTHVSGQNLLTCLYDSGGGTERAHEVSSAIADTMMTLWSAGLCHGDLTIENILCDDRARRLSFVDCGPKSECRAYAEVRDPRSLAVHDLAHLISHEGETLLMTLGRPKRWRLRRLLIERVLLAVVAEEPSFAAKIAFLVDLGRCARAHLDDPKPLYTGLGLWQTLKRSAGLRRMNRILESVKQQIAVESISAGKQTSRPSHPAAVITVRPQLSDRRGAMNETIGDGAPVPCAMPEQMPRRSLLARVAGRLLRETRSMLGLASFMKNEDRRVLERVIFPHLIENPACRDVLFVGCDWYTAGYSAWFADKNYWTLDVDPAMRRFGATQHIVDGLQNIAQHFPADSLDLIVCNGVFGWGLNAASDVEQALRGCCDALRVGGLLIVGVDSVEERRAYALESSKALQTLELYVFPPLQTADYLTDTPYGHRYLFFRKPSRRPAAHDGGDGSENTLASKPERTVQRRSWLRRQNWSLSSYGMDSFKRAWRLCTAEIKYLFGVDSHLISEDRRVLEQVIFPYFLRDDAYRAVLFVGCSWCTRGYNSRFEQRKNYWTIDDSPLKRRYGARQHITAPLQDLGHHFQPGTLDLIICNGVYGWGLDERADIEAAFTACHKALRENGVLVIGWADVEHLNPCPLSTWQCLQSFRPFVFPPLGTAEFVTETEHRHTYNFYRRSSAADLRAKTDEENAHADTGLRDLELGRRPSARRARG